MNELKRLVYMFRMAIEKAIENGEEGTFFAKFPKGQCGITSELLAQFLIDNGFDSIEYMCGTFRGDQHEEIQSHAWLIIEQNIVDITSDQFVNYEGKLKNNRKVYVGPVDDYYKIFDCHEADRHPQYRLNPKWPNYNELKRNYETIMKYI